MVRNKIHGMKLQIKIISQIDGDHGVGADNMKDDDTDNSMSNNGGILLIVSRFNNGEVILVSNFNRR
uniref:Uncharacterized protein n=1 Tax=Strongyloides papillosus TaxID=174720 RepID=A0A0N5B4Q7_STREA